ncbi:MAG: ABC transporter permease [Christensenellales bacterium]
MRIVARDSISGRKAFLIRFLGVVCALLTGMIFLAIAGFDPFSAMISLLEGAFGNGRRIAKTVEFAIPLVITSLGISLAFRMKFWNIGAEGQICMGAFAASYFALFCADWPVWLLFSAMTAASFAAGALWAAIPAFLKVKWGTNETLVTLMLNYIAIKIIQYLQYNAWKDPGARGFPKIAMFDAKALLPQIFGVNIGWIVAIGLIAVIYFFITRSKGGYRINVIGESADTARYAGINVHKTMVITVCIGGALAGLAGMIQATGVERTLNETLSAGYGYTAIITAWLARLNPVAIGIVCILFAALTQGGNFIQTAYNIPSAAASVFQGLVLLFVLASEFFLRYKIVRSLPRGAQ